MSNWVQLSTIIARLDRIQSINIEEIAPNQWGLVITFVDGKTEVVAAKDKEDASQALSHVYWNLEGIIKAKFRDEGADSPSQPTSTMSSNK